MSKDALLQVRLDGSKKESEDNTQNHDAGFGCLHKYANPNLIPLEKTAWADAAAEKHNNSTDANISE